MFFLWRKCRYSIREKLEIYLIFLLDHCWLSPSITFSLSTLPGISGHSFPEGYRLSFPTRTNYMYAVVKHSIPTLRAFTVCLWLRPAEGGIGTPLSYAVPEQPNEVVLLQGLHTPTELLINDKVFCSSIAAGRSRDCACIIYCSICQHRGLPVCAL